MANINILFTIGESHKSFIKNNTPHIQTNHQAAGLSFYRYDWKKPDSGKAILHSTKNYQLEFNYPLAIIGTIDNAIPSEGLSSFYITAQLDKNDSIQHEKAMTLLQVFFRKIKSEGWMRYISIDTPRLEGKYSYKYFMHEMHSSAYYMDSDYLHTLSEWMTIKDSIKWAFFKKNYILQVTLRRNPKKMDPEQLGDYFIVYDVYSIENLIRDYIESEDYHRWREVWPLMRDKALAYRHKKEKALYDEGYQILQDYKNPEFDYKIVDEIRKQ